MKALLILLITLFTALASAAVYKPHTLIDQNTPAYLQKHQCDAKYGTSCIEIPLDYRPEYHIAEAIIGDDITKPIYADDETKPIFIDDENKPLYGDDETKPITEDNLDSPLYTEVDILVCADQAACEEQIASTPCTDIALTREADAEFTKTFCLEQSGYVQTITGYEQKIIGYEKVQDGYEQKIIGYEQTTVGYQVVEDATKKATYDAEQAIIASREQRLKDMDFGRTLIADIANRNAAKDITTDQVVEISNLYSPILSTLQTGSITTAKVQITTLEVTTLHTQDDKDYILGQIKTYLGL